MIKITNIKNNRRCIRNIKRLYKEAFPKEEQVPFFLLKYKAMKGKANFYGIYDKNEFIGLLYTVCYKDIVFLFYLAIHSKKRGNGYGSVILEKVKHKFKNHRIILNIEEVDENNSNFEQRQKRKKFYIKNGFKDSNIKTKENHVIYEMLYCGGNVTYEEYSELMKNCLGNFLFKMLYKKIDK